MIDLFASALFSLLSLLILLAFKFQRVLEICFSLIENKDMESESVKFGGKFGFKLCFFFFYFGI